MDFSQAYSQQPALLESPSSANEMPGLVTYASDTFLLQESIKTLEGILQKLENINDSPTCILI